MSTDVYDRFATLAEEHERADAVSNAAFGFWVYLMSDCILFAALFATFVVLGGNYAGGASGRELFDLPYTFAETMFLLSSSVTNGLAMLAVQEGRRARLLGWLVVTFLLGLGFVGLEVHEFVRLVAAGDGPGRSGFLSGFFALVGTHGAHVTLGLLWMAIMMIQIATKGLTAPVRSRLMRLSMFWHFLDIIWIGVFTIVYLMGVL